MMRRDPRWLFVLGLAAWFGGCSEETHKPPVDTVGPDVRILVPDDEPSRPCIVSDSIDVFVGAHGAGADGVFGVIAGVAVFAARPGNAEPLRIGEASAPIPLDSVPEPLRPHVQLPAGWGLYTVRWHTSWHQPGGGTPIVSCSRLELYATATEVGGTEVRATDSVAVVVLNSSDHLSLVRAEFTVQPTNGLVDSLFWFDPTPTEDGCFPDHEVFVRWDFDGTPENGWDIDWSADARADEVVTRRFAQQGIYTIRMEARDALFPDSVSAAPSRTIRVLPGWPDRPPPPDYENYVTVPAGIYPISKADSVFVLDGRRVRVDTSELPAHSVRITQPFGISKYEVTNRQYLGYLEAERQEPYPWLVLADGAIWEREPGGGRGKLLCMLDASRIFYDLDRQRLAIQAGFEEHPITGVTWYGAMAFALRYGLRLPSEAEWEAAGRGAAGDLDFPFPRGIDLSLDEARRRMNFADAFAPGEEFDGTTTPVGYFRGTSGTIDTKSEFGLYDLAGNAAEWVSDWFGPYESGTLDDPTGPAAGTRKVARGGSHAGTRVDCRVTARRAYEPEDYSPGRGFRCVWNTF